MERQHFVVLIDPVGRGRKTKHPSTGDESAACGERARENIRKAERGQTRFAGSGTSVAGSPASERVETSAGKAGKRDRRNRARE